MTPLYYPLPEPAIVSSPFTHSRKNPFGHGYQKHLAVDLAAPQGTPVRSAISGKVTFAGWNGGCGNGVVVQNENQKTLYCHLSSIAVKKGREISQGTIVGEVGSTGQSTGPHLHWAYWAKEADRWNPKDPLKFLLPGRIVVAD